MKKSFESSLTELEQIVRQLEDGDLPLEESLKLFESGVKLTRECRERLDEAERRIEVLLKDSQGNPVLEPLETEDLRETPPGKRISFDDDEF
ncbi:MAG: exodeoxyribonuclease VII small subunit [Acidobacteria bacterium]|nr:exodeoxyribonuclease VII small subunit [Acidobacteriota bacterium]MBK8151570.1 exodeoxyribonuclease VII small subunit [Acidobacteriota bacterium]MBK8812590.1 exodeoxyribonuclease VII small subunit [Acidobacteriota bacterium]